LVLKIRLVDTFCAFLEWRVWENKEVWGTGLSSWRLMVRTREVVIWEWRLVKPVEGETG
jgi:hypothetical protein